MSKLDLTQIYLELEHEIKHLSQSTIVTCRDAMREDAQSVISELKPEYNICEGGRGAAAARVGKKHSKETKERLREFGLASIDKFKKYQHLGPASQRKKVVCLNTGEIFESTVAAAREKNVNQISLLYVCNRHPARKTAGGLVFRYFGDHFGGKEEAKEIINYMIAHTKKKGGRFVLRQDAICG